MVREEKLAIVAQIASSTVSAVARRHRIAPSLLFRWKREFEGTAAAKPEAPVFVRVALPAPEEEHRAGATGGGCDGAIEIVLTGGRRVVVGTGADMTILKQVIAILEARPVRHSPQGDGG